MPIEVSDYYQKAVKIWYHENAKYLHITDICIYKKKPVRKLIITAMQHCSKD
jgi:hypothetical protein